MTSAIETRGKPDLLQMVKEGFFPKPPSPEKLMQLAQRISELEEPALSINCNLSRVLVNADGKYSFVVPVVNHGALKKDSTSYTFVPNEIIKNVTRGGRTTTSTVTSARELIGLQKQMGATEQRYSKLRDARLSRMR